MAYFGDTLAHSALLGVAFGFLLRDSLPILQTVRSYLEITDAYQAPDAVFERGAQAAEAEIDRLVTALRGTRGGRLKAGLARWAARRMRALVGLRESPKFFIIQFMGIIRQELLDGQAPPPIVEKINEEDLLDEELIDEEYEE